MLARCVATLKPPPELTLSQWADRYRMLSAESSAEPGRWHTDKAPYQREIMKIIEKNEGKKINYNLTGTKLDFADGALTLDLARYQQDDPVTRDIMVDSEGYLTTGRGLYYAAQVEIPARKYTETVTPAQENDAQTEGGESTEGMNRETVTRTPEPLDTEAVTLYLFAIDGIMIH